MIRSKALRRRLFLFVGPATFLLSPLTALAQYNDKDEPEGSPVIIVQEPNGSQPHYQEQPQAYPQAEIQPVQRAAYEQQLQAQADQNAPTSENSMRVGIHLDGALYSGDTLETRTHPSVIETTASFIPRLIIDGGEGGMRAAIPFAYSVLGATSTLAETSRFVMGNLMLEGFLDIEFERSNIGERYLRLKAGLALPTANDPSDREANYARQLAQVTTPIDWILLWTSHRTTPTVGVEAEVSDQGYVLGGRFDLALSFYHGPELMGPVQRSIVSGSTEFLVQAEGHFAFRIRQILNLGLSVGFWALPTQQKNNYQGFIEPYVQSDRQAPWFGYARLGVMLYYGDPWGPSFDPGKFYAVRLSLGLDF